MDITEAVRPDPQIETYAETERRTAPDRLTDHQLLMDAARDRVRQYRNTPGPGVDVMAFCWGWLQEAASNTHTPPAIVTGLALALEQGRQGPC